MVYLTLGPWEACWVWYTPEDHGRHAGCISHLMNPGRHAGCISHLYDPGRHAGCVYPIFMTQGGMLGVLSPPMYPGRHAGCTISLEEREATLVGIAGREPTLVYIPTLPWCIYRDTHPGIHRPSGYTQHSAVLMVPAATCTPCRQCVMMRAWALTLG